MHTTVPCNKIELVRVTVIMGFIYMPEMKSIADFLEIFFLQTKKKDFKIKLNLLSKFHKENIEKENSNKTLALAHI